MKDIVTFALGVPAGVLSLFAGIAIYQSWSPMMSWALLVGVPVTVVAAAVVVVIAVRASHIPTHQVIDAPSRQLDLRDEGRWLDNRLKWHKLTDAEERAPLMRLPATGPGPVTVNDRWLEELA